MNDGLAAWATQALDRDLPLEGVKVLPLIVQLTQLPLQLLSDRRQVRSSPYCQRSCRPRPIQACAKTHTITLSNLFDCPPASWFMIGSTLIASPNTLQTRAQPPVHTQS